MLNYVFISFILFFGLNGYSEDQFARRIQAHLILRDFPSAIEECQKGLNQYSNSLSLHESYINALAQQGNEQAMLMAWKAYALKFPDQKENRKVIEQMCWGILNKASKSSSLIIRLMSVLAAYVSEDSQGVHILKNAMHDPNHYIRVYGVKLSSKYRDSILIDEIKWLFDHETAWSIRKEVIKAIGEMKINDLNSSLEDMIASSQTTAEEKALAINSLVEIWKDVKTDKIKILVQSNRAGLRLLAVKALLEFGSENDVDTLIQLADDSHPDVQANALQALGVIRPQKQEAKQKILNLVQTKICQSDVKTALSAAWVVALYDPLEGQNIIKKYLDSKNQEERILASAVLNATGKYGVETAAYYLENSKDPYVQFNLALGLISQRAHVEKAAMIIEQVLNQNKDKLFWMDEDLFSYITPQNLKGLVDDSLESPEMEDQIVRLKVLNVLAIVEPMRAQQAIRQFLAEQAWGITGIASALLLMEGNDASSDIVLTLLKDQNKKVRIQAALVLSLWSRSEEAIEVLQQSYSTVDRDLKVKILEGLGRIGSMHSVPFLINELNDPSQHLRIVAAIALFQCLNH